MNGLSNGQLCSYGLGQVIEVSMQQAINEMVGGQSHMYPNSPPLYLDTAHEFYRVPGSEGSQVEGGTAIGTDAFMNFGTPSAALGHHFIYNRLEDPNGVILSRTAANALSVLSDRKIDVHVFNAGMSAFAAAFRVLQYGDTIYHHPILYGCTYDEITSRFRELKINAVSFDMEDVSVLRARLMADESARMVAYETLVNPTLAVPPTDDIAPMIDEVNKTRLDKGWKPVVLLVDNTFQTFACMNVFKFGVHFALESLTKFISGDGENMGGMLEIDMNHDFHVDNDGGLYALLARGKKNVGLSLSPHHARNITLGLRSLEMRRGHVLGNAQLVAEHLKESPYVKTLRYPGMTGDSVQDDRARRLFLDEFGRFSPGSIIYIELHGTPEEALKNSLRLLDWLGRETSLRVKVSFGQPTTNVEPPGGMTHLIYGSPLLFTGIRIAIGWNSARYVNDCFDAGFRHVLGRR